MANGTGLLRNQAEIPWFEGAGHHGGALSKVLVGVGEDGARRVDYRISSYAPAAHVARHLHEDKEQVYHFLEGEGLLELGEASRVVRAGDVAYIPPHLPHALQNTGLGRLVFVVVTIPLANG